MTHIDRVRALLAELDQACFLHDNSGHSGDLPMLYFIQAGDDGPIKIGHATSPRDRLWDLQSGNHLQLHVLLELPGTVHAERAAHHAFADLRIRGEWFRADRRLLAFIECFTSGSARMELAREMVAA